MSYIVLINMSKEKFDELKYHLEMNRYKFRFSEYHAREMYIEVLEDEVEFVQTILMDRDIEHCSGEIYCSYQACCEFCVLNYDEGCRIHRQ